VEARTLIEVLRHHRGGNVLFDLEVDGEAPGGYAAIIKQLQMDPVSDELLSVDFQWVSLTEAVQVSVPVHPQGEAAGVKAGGMLEQVLHDLLVSCLPTEIPPGIPVDVSNLEMGQTLHVSDLVIPDGVRVLTNAEESVVTVRPPHVVTEVAPAEAAEGAEEAEAEEAEGEAEEQDLPEPGDRRKVR
jgi:large subunit ribosomal protein L25